MFFEGAEKKAEIIIDSASLNLLTDFDNDYWEQLVAHCQAKILSSIKNQNCTAYLLSESSLFVWADRFVIITCGETLLIESIQYFLNSVKKILIKHIIYQRKNEYFSYLQPSNALEDIKRLTAKVDGVSYRFGSIDSHHTFIFHQKNEFRFNINNTTYELLIYQISKQASELLTQPNLNKASIRKFLKLPQLLPGFELDDFVFEPFGYSLNAIKGNDYFTVHITPQSHSSYVSFESSLDLLSMSPIFLEVFQPASFDIISFNETQFDNKIEANIPAKYIPKERVKQQLENAYQVNFANFIRPQKDYTQATKLILDGEHYVF